MADYKFRYTVAAYELDFLALYLPVLLNADYPTMAEIRIQDTEAKSYKVSPSSPFPDLRTNRISLKEASLWFSRTDRLFEANFLDKFLNYYIDTAEKELKAGNLRAAVDALKNDTTYRGYSNDTLRAEIFYAQSDFRGAMNAYREGLQNEDEFRYEWVFYPEPYEFQALLFRGRIAAGISEYPFLNIEGYPGDPKKKKAWHDFLLETQVGRVARKEPKSGHCADYERLDTYDRWVVDIIAGDIRRGEW